jgi:hypothetical protein
VSLKSLTTGVAAAVTVGAAAIGVTSLASATETISTPIAPVVFGVPLPQTPGDNLPSAGDLTSILTQLADPGVGFHSGKSNLVEGGIGIIEGKTADRLLQNANSNGSLPLVFNVSPPTPAGDNAVSAVVTASGPHLAPTTQTLTFVNQGGQWKLSKGSATSLLQSAAASA